LTLPKTIKKRDDSIVEFKLEKVANAISKAGKETGEFDEEVSKILAQDVLNALK